jgi:hypothetical protein
MLQAEVLVAGGGPAGVCAAISAARNGAQTLLVERYGFLGGTATMACMGPIAPFHHRDEQVVFGIAQEIIERLVALGASTGHLKLVRSHGAGSYMCWYDRESYKWLLVDMLQEAGAELLLHTQVTGAVVEGGRIRAVRVVNKGGEAAIPAKAVIDATGDGDVLAACGAPFEIGRANDGVPMAMSHLFEMANVDVPRLRRFIEEHPAEFEWWSPADMPRPLRLDFAQDHFAAQGFLSTIREARATGEFHLGLDAPIIVTGIWPQTVSLNATRVVKKLAVNPADLTDAELEGRRQVMSLAACLRRHVPGFENSHVSATAVQVGVRESRRAVGEYVLTGEDVRCGRKFRDAIARGYFPIDVHDPRGPGSYRSGGSTWVELEDSYDIPYRSCLPLNIDGLLVAGRCISATHEAIGSVRSTGSCMAVGEAAGAAAMVAVRRSALPRQIDYEELRDLLEAQGASIRRQAGQRPGERNLTLPRTL